MTPEPRETPTLRDALDALVIAALRYSPREDHDWRCEYRSAEMGWVQGGPPVIICECGFDELGVAVRDAEAALEAASEAQPAPSRLDREALAWALHDFRLGCRLDFRGDWDCNGPKHHVRTAGQIVLALTPKGAKP